MPITRLLVLRIESLCNGSKKTTRPIPDSAESIETGALERLLLERHSCRAFLPDAVPRPIIRRSSRSRSAPLRGATLRLGKLS